MPLKLTISRSVLVVFIVLVAIIGGMSGLEGANLRRQPVTVTTTLQQAVYATVTESVISHYMIGDDFMIVNCISFNLGTYNNPGPMNPPDYFSIGWSAAPPGPGSLKIGLWGVSQPVLATVDYAADSSSTFVNGNYFSAPTSMNEIQFTIPATPFDTYYGQIVPVPLPPGASSVDFNLAPSNGSAGVMCLTLTWIPG
jgi:hypothetical protein